MVLKYNRECLACFNMVHHERHDVFFRYHKGKRKHYSNREVQQQL